MRRPLALFMLLAVGCVQTPPAPKARTAPPEPPRTAKPSIDLPPFAPPAGILPAGELRGGVYTVCIPRDDLNVETDLSRVPVAAGLEHRFHFFQCSTCSTPRSILLGEWVLIDYEVNDVLGLMQEHGIKIAGMTPFMLAEKPRLMLLRVQGEGDAATLAQAIRKTLPFTGEERLRPPPLPR